ncbi:MAG: dephospho-CoA kinase [Puniceicoccales bacterium]|jgi:dephospho-CoA kinase|nr:dephospho-CoA kinase [Puniceicoccales bacterium]
MKIALTGGIACGKSTAGTAFAKRGCAVLSADAIAHEVLDSAEVAGELREIFGGDVFLAEGRVNRVALGAAVFSDAGLRRRLEAVVHPRVEARWRAAVAGAPTQTWVIEVPLLFEARLEAGFDAVACVHCSEAVQRGRMAARGLSAAEGALRIAAQWPLAEKMRRAQVCLFNEGALEFLEAQVTAVLRELRQS